MSPLLPTGLAIALNAAVLVVGSFWIKRQAKRAEIERGACERGADLSEERFNER